MIRYCCFIVVGIMLTACQVNRSNLDNAVDDLLIKGGETFNMMNPYAVIQHDFKRGLIMRARSRVLAMPKSSRDYKKAHQLLNEKIEPARRRIFIHYLRKAKALEKNKRWSEAMWAYDQAMAVTIKPDNMQQKREEMVRYMRQLRLEKLLQLRRKEDRTLFSYANAYEPPKGISPTDEIYERMRDHYDDMLNERESMALREAMRFFRKGKPEIAYIEIESYLRLQPDSTKGKKILALIKLKIPPFLKIPVEPSTTSATVKPVFIKRASHAKVVTAGQIQAAMKAGDWLKAKQLAHIYRRNGSDGADKLLAQVQKKTHAMAASLFAKGSVAFRKEQLDRSIHYWRDAVALVPEVSEYVESLRRAQQLQERLMLLQEQK